MPYIDVTFEVVTPAYAGGANRAETDGLRPPTLKSLLRSWWRAMHPNLAGTQLFDQEARIFGAPRYSNNDPCGQGIRLAPLGPWQKPQTHPPGTLENDPLHVYMAYGAVAWDKTSKADPARIRRGKKGASVTQVERISPGGNARIRIFTPDEDTKREIKRTLWMLSAFGGIGSRSRRGWGSLRISVDDLCGLPDPHVNLEKATETLQEGLSQLLGKRSTIPLSAGLAQPQWNAFSPKSRVFVGPSYSGPDAGKQALESAYVVYAGFRKWLGKDLSTGNGGVDYDTRRQWLTTSPKPGDPLPYGSNDGLPHNAQFDPPKGPRVDVGVGSDLKGRRASSLFVKILRERAGNEPKARAVILWLPCEFLPHGMKAYVRVRGCTVELSDRGHIGVQAFLSGSRGLIKSASHWPGLSSMGWKEVTW